MLKYLNRSKKPLYEKSFTAKDSSTVYLWKLQCSTMTLIQRTTYGFVNNITTPEGGTHIVGFRNALTKTFNDYARKNKLLKDSEPNLSGDDIREGLTAIVSVKLKIHSLKVRQNRN